MWKCSGKDEKTLWIGAAAVPEYTDIGHGASGTEGPFLIYRDIFLRGISEAGNKMIRRSAWRFRG